MSASESRAHDPAGELAFPRPQARPLIFPELARSSETRGPLFTLPMLGDLPFTLEAPLGSIDLDVRALLDLRRGSVLQLDRFTGEPLEVTVNGTAIARGEVRIHGERFAVRVTEILRAEGREGVEGGKHAPAKGNPDASRAGDGGDSRARVGR
jgi:flagellar motor switch protein FliN/FliY